MRTLPPAQDDDRSRSAASGPALESVLVCPECGYGAAETMPTDRCVFFYKCAACNAVLRPLAGHCCVFCSYGTVPCPPMQCGT